MTNLKTIAPDGLRRKTYDFLEFGSFGGRLAAAFDGFMIFMIIANIFAVMLETVPSLWGPHKEWFQLFDRVSVIIFTIEYGARVWASAEREIVPGETPMQRRLRYIYSPFALIDLIAILPFYLGAVLPLDLRALRIFRLLRLLKLVRYSPALSSLGRVIFTERRALFAALIVMLGLEVAAATLMYLVEHEVQPESFGSIPDALWWALATLTTVGYGDVVPISATGKVIAGVVMILGLAFYAIPIGIVASGFTDEVHRREFTVPVGLIEKFPVFSGLSVDVLREISSRVRSLSLQPGTVMTHPRDTGNGVYFVLSGEVQAFYKRRPFPLRAGDFFGEFGVLNEGALQPATVVHSRSKVMWLESLDLHTLLMIYPEIVEALDSFTTVQLFKFIEEGRLTETEAKKLSEPIDLKYT